MQPVSRLADRRRKSFGLVSNCPPPNAGQMTLSARARARDIPHMYRPQPLTSDPEIIGGPTPIKAPRPGTTYRFKVQHGTAEKHVYVQIADSLRPEAFAEPLRSGIESKGESVLVKLLERGNVPTRIKITSAGITEVGIDRRQRACAF
jgi:hypothetical protein